MTKINQIRGRSLALWAMLVICGKVKRNGLPLTELKSMLLLDYGEEVYLDDVISAANEYLKRREGGVEIVKTHSNGVSLRDTSGDDGIEEVFNHWKSTQKSDRSKLTAERASIIRARLRDGYSVEELKAAIDGLAASEFHQKGGYTCLRYALRNEDAIKRMTESVKTAKVDDIWEQALRDQLSRKR